jgi:hypothetical protein
MKKLAVTSNTAMIATAERISINVKALRFS